MSSPRAGILAPLVLLATVACGDAGGDGAAPDATRFGAARAHAFRLHEERAEPQAVLDALLAAHVLQPEAVGVNRRLGEVYVQLGQDAEALQHYERAARALPDDDELAMSVLTLHVRLGHDEQARALLPRLLADASLAGDALHQQALLFDYEGHRELALATVERAAELDPANASPCLALHGRFLFEAGDFGAAAERFEAALAGRPDSVEALKGLADSSRRLGRETLALHWDEVLEQMLLLQDDEYIRRRPEDRKRALRRLVEIHPAWGHGWRQLAALLQREGDDAAACRTIEGFLAVHGDGLDPETVGRLRERYCR